MDKATANNFDAQFHLTSMKITYLLLVFFLLVSCSSTRFVDSWKNPEINRFEPNKLLVVGMTDNLTARRIFEEQLRIALSRRGINASESSEIIDASFTNSKKTEDEIAAMKDELIEDGFDAVIITAVIGVDERRSYRSGYYTFGYSRWYRFGRYYYRFQDVYYTPGYYQDYRVFHVETSIYNFKEDEDRSLVWVGTFDIIDPSGITSTVNDYVNRIIHQLEEEGLIVALK